MKKKLLSRSLILIMLFVGFAQSIKAQSTTMKLRRLPETPAISFSAPNLSTIHEEDAMNDRNGGLYRIGVPIYTQITTENAGSWTTQPNGDRVWQLHVKSPGAEALSFLFEKFHLHDAATIDIFDPNGNQLHRTYTANDVLDHGMQNMSLCFGDEMTIQITEPHGTQPSEILMDRIMYGYRSTGNPASPAGINESESCEINVNCSPVGNNWQDEKRGVARILIVDSQGQGWCTGSLVNNTALNCKPYFLTALHCGVNTSASNSNQWRFYFRYEAPTCTNPSTAGTLDDYFITGCVRLAHSNDGGGNTGSDFLLVQLGSLANEASTITTLKSTNFNAFWNGWDANNTATTGGVGIHHPAGDIKKISTFNGTTTTSGWNGNGLQSHWQISWSANANGHGVTEGGSSGSPLFNNSHGRIIGTLTGGSSYCNALTSPDQYGKMSFHWTSNGSPANEQLKTYLDPGNTGLLVLNGSNDPCAAPSQPPVANFSATPLTVCPGSTVTFTDISTNAPTSWAWSFPGGTPSTSTAQNPTVTYATAGTYNVTLTATNAFGSDQEVKSSYITVQGNGSALPLTEGFTNTTFVPAGWSLVNANSSPTTWARTTVAGNAPTTGNSMMFDNFNYNDADDDEVRLQAVSLIGQSTPELKFDVAYAPYNGSNFDGLQVLISTNCGATFTSIYNKSNTTLATAPATTSAFTPTTAQWRTETVSLTPYAGQGNVIIAFRNLSGYGNRLFVDNINISGVAPVTPAFSTSQPSACTGQTITVTDASVGATSWSWNFGAGATPATATGVGPHTVTYATSGTKTITLTINGASTTTQTVTINSAATPTISASGATTFCAGNSVTLTSSASSGNTWSNGSNAQSITVSTAGTYTLTTTSNGCVSSPASQTVSVNPIPATPTISAGGPTTFCAGNSVTLTSSASSGNTWSNGSNAQSITVSTAGTYTVTTTSNGCVSSPASQTVSVNPTPATPTISATGSTTFCAGNSVTLTSSAPSGNTWSNGSNAQSITVSSAGTYTLTATSNGCTSGVASQIVTVNPSPTIAVNTVNAPVSCGTNTGSLVIGGSGTGTLNWSGTASGTQNSATLPVTIPNLGAGSYQVIFTSATGCASNQLTQSINDPSAPPTPTISANGPLTFCQGGSVVLTSSATSGNTWSNGNSGQSITVSSSGTYTVTTTVGGCSSSSTSTVINVVPTPVIAQSGSSNSTNCVTPNGSISVSGTGTGTISWSGAGSGSLNTTLPATLSNLQAGTYTIQFVSQDGCTSNSITQSISGPVAPAAPQVTSNNNSPCVGETVTLVSSQSTGNNWSTGASGSAITVTQSGNYSVTYTDNNGCTSSPTSTIVTFNNLPAVSFGSIPELCVYDAAITLNQGSPAGGNYSGGGVSGSTFNPSVAGIGSTTLTYIYTDGNGCSNTATTTVLVDDCASLEESGSVAVLIFPNPSNGSITIDGGNVQLESIKIYDYAGKLVNIIHDVQSTKTTIDLALYSQGAYHITVATQNGISHQKLMLNK